MMRKLIFTITLLCWALPISAATPPGELFRFSRQHAPAEVHAEVVNYYQHEDLGTKNFMLETWPRAHAWMNEAGVEPKHQTTLFYLILRESTWRHRVWNEQGSSAYGLCQTMMSYHGDTVSADFMTNPVSQIEWCNDHALAYKEYAGKTGYEAVFAHWTDKNWW